MISVKYLMHWVGSSFLWRLEMCLGVMQHDIFCLHDILQRIQYVVVIQKLSKRCVMMLQVVYSLHLRCGNL